MANAYKHLRRKRFVDPSVQGALVYGMVRYWLISLIAVSGLTVLGWIFIHPGIGPLFDSIETLTSIIPMFIIATVATLCMLPLIVWDLVGLSHRFAGPMLRLRRSLESLAEGDDVARLEFRDDDYWHEFADLFNRVLERIEADKGGLHRDPGPTIFGDESSAEIEAAIGNCRTGERAELVAIPAGSPADE